MYDFGDSRFFGLERAVWQSALAALRGQIWTPKPRRVRV